MGGRTWIYLGFKIFCESLSRVVFFFFFFSFRLDWKWPSNESNFHSQRNVHRGGKIILESDLSTQIVIYLYIYKYIYFAPWELSTNYRSCKDFNSMFWQFYYIYIYIRYSCKFEKVGKKIYDHLTTIINFTSFIPLLLFRAATLIQEWDDESDFRTRLHVRNKLIKILVRLRERWPKLLTQLRE